MGQGTPGLVAGDRSEQALHYPESPGSGRTGTAEAIAPGIGRPN